MELVEHTLIHCTKSPEVISPSVATISDRRCLKSVDLVIIRASERHFINHTDCKNEHNVELDSHVLINRDGSVYQSIPFDKQVDADIAGSWEGLSDLRSKSVIITLENCGRLDKKADKFYSGCGRTFDTNDVFTGIHQNEETLSYWQKFTNSQVQIAEKIIRCLTSTYQVKYILGNEEVCPGLQKDPGPAFPLEILRRRIVRENMLHNHQNTSEADPSGRFDLNAILGRQQSYSPENKNARIVNIRKKNGGWYKLNIDLGGFIKEEWVSI